VLDAAKGGVATAWMLYEMKARGVVPTALVLNVVNPIMVQGAALADFTMISGFDLDITHAIPNGALVEIQSGWRTTIHSYCLISHARPTQVWAPKLSNVRVGSRTDERTPQALESAPSAKQTWGRRSLAREGPEFQTPSWLQNITRHHHARAMSAWTSLSGHRAAPLPCLLGPEAVIRPMWKIRRARLQRL